MILTPTTLQIGRQIGGTTTSNGVLYGSSTGLLTQASELTISPGSGVVIGKSLFDTQANPMFVQDTGGGGREYWCGPTYFSIPKNDGTGLLVQIRNSSYGLFGTLAPQATITGSRGGNAALASLLTAGAANGLWIDGTTA